MKTTLLILLTLVSVLGCQKTAQTPLETLREANGFTETVTRGVKEISPQARLRKLSLHLKGLAPELAEYEALDKALLEGTAADFFTAKTKEYLEGPRFVGKMVGRIDSLLRFKLSSNLPESRHIGLGQSTADPSLNAGNEDYNSLGFLVEKVVGENLSWDTLLTGKTYKVQYPPPSVFNRVNDLSFFKPIAPELPQTEEPPPGVIVITPSPTPVPAPKLIDVPIKPDDNRVAGIVTTARFFSRYNTTNLNKSRGRAAAIFRTFLCDDMRAVVEPKPGEEEELLKNAFPKPSRDHAHALLTDDDPHGSQPSCMACHYKLDPMGKTFINFGNVMASDPSPGALVFKKADGSEINMQGQGLGEVLSFITLQEEYKRCQVNHFWKWFVRGDESPGERQLQELVKVFDSVGHRPKDFISHLVNLPEFRIHPEAVTSNVDLTQVSPTLSRCDQCHTGVTSSTIPSFIKFPIGGSENKHREYLAEISRKLDLINDGAAKKMPPKSSPWQPTKAELLQIKDWVRQGAKDSFGNATIEEAFAKTLVGDYTPASPKGSFRDSYVRYTSTHDLIRRFRQVFPDLKESPSHQCLTLSDGNRMLLGEPNPLTGELAYSGPSPAYVKFFGLCLLKLIAEDLDAAASKPAGLHRYFGVEAVDALKNSPQAVALEKPKDVQWKDIPSPTQTLIAKHLVFTLIGPGVMKNEDGYIRKLVETFQSDKEVKTTYDALSKILFYIGTQDEFLSY